MEVDGAVPPTVGGDHPVFTAHRSGATSHYACLPDPTRVPRDGAAGIAQPDLAAGTVVPALLDSLAGLFIGGTVVLPHLPGIPIALIAFL